MRKLLIHFKKKNFNFDEYFITAVEETIYKKISGFQTVMKKHWNTQLPIGNKLYF